MPKNNFLYHYTDARGLLGILDQEKIRLTNRKCMSDFREFHHSQPHLTDIIKKTILECYPEISIKDPEGHLLNLEGDRLYDILTKHTPDAFLTCFCKHAKESEQNNGLLSMWRGYGRDGGYALVFNKQSISGASFGKNLDKIKAMCLISKVYYLEEPEPLPNSLKSYEQQFTFFIKRNVNYFIHGNQNNTRLDFEEKDFEAILRLIAQIKHSGFKEENEFRLCVFYKSLIEHAIPLKLKENLVAYIEFPIDLKSSLKKIIIGPQRDITTKNDLLKKYLTSKGLENVEVLNSNIPYLPR